MGSVFGTTGPLAERALTGRAAVSLGFDGSTLQLAGAVVGARGTAASGTTSVADLPAGTVAGFGFAGADDLVREAWTQVRALASDTGASATLDEQVRQLREGMGLRVPDDVVAAVGDQVAVAVGGSGNAPGVAVRLSGNERAVRKLADVVQETVGMSPATAADTARGGTVLASSPAYASAVASGSGLGGTKVFQDAVPEAAGAQAVLFVDVARVLTGFSEELDLDAEARSNLQPLAAFGLSARQDGTTARFTARLTTR